jgi:hypothetical protein
MGVPCREIGVSYRAGILNATSSVLSSNVRALIGISSRDFELDLDEDEDS